MVRNIKIYIYIYLNNFIYVLNLNNYNSHNLYIFKFNFPIKNKFPVFGTYICLILRGYPPKFYIYLAKNNEINFSHFFPNIYILKDPLPLFLK